MHSRGEEEYGALGVEKNPKKTLFFKRFNSVAKHARQFSYSFTAGAVSGMVNTLVLSPLDVVRTRMQVGSFGNTAHALRTGSGLELRHFRDVFRATFRTEGIGGFYRGLTASLMAFMPNWAIYFSLYEQLRGTLLEQWSKNPPKRSRLGANLFPSRGLSKDMLASMMASMGAGAATALLCSPLWVVKTRMQAEVVLPGSVPRYRNPLECLRRIAREEGLAALYRGLTPSLLGLIHVAVQFPLYEALKRSWVVSRPRSKEPGASTSALTEARPPVWRIMVASSVSKIVASAVAYPHEVIRSRLQMISILSVESGIPPPEPFLNRTAKGIGTEPVRMLRLVRYMLKEEGISAFYRGIGATLFRTLPATVLTFVTYELCKTFLEERAQESSLV
ncbi:similar to mitochondrial carrier protein [Cyanidioschyzon merolae strain 10D]|uniref:Similar to mitochondrial carrier protein n=1 Tax=Cyanidioschyzon merolae (strain NIES-3377 / 10D) TaxID=280699 RepID=M1V5E6_CYAM1|nr:similar to mitochondrial carrier protein [Cyanidioschyzon merolae strain 10D]BAM80535.1 similar to mitochondrial carrier protein [Cyanidioschyzon merolae strain 10D]|eukprot:XP_005536571.1 similar to mitochondrial carrier protein [Cyanidioschyzon merolae strain 10D]